MGRVGGSLSGNLGVMGMPYQGVIYEGWSFFLRISWISLRADFLWCFMGSWQELQVRIWLSFDSRVDLLPVISWVMDTPVKITARSTFRRLNAGAQIHTGPSHKKRVLYNLTPLDCMIVCTLYVEHGIFYVWCRLKGRILPRNILNINFLSLEPLIISSFFGFFRNELKPLVCAGWDRQVGKGFVGRHGFAHGWVQREP